MLACPTHCSTRHCWPDRLPPFAGYRTIRCEVCLGESCFDFLLEDEERRCWIETKSVTLVENGVALFPNAPDVAHDTIVVA